MLNINNNLVSSFYTRNNKHVKKHIVRTLRRSPLTIYIRYDREGLDQLTHFDVRNTGHKIFLSMEEEGDFLDQRYVMNEMKYMFGDEDGKSDRKEVTDGIQKLKPFPEKALKKITEKVEKNMPRKFNAVGTSDPPSDRGCGRGRRLQQRKEQYGVGKRRPYEVVEATMEAMLKNAEEASLTMETTSSGIGMSNCESDLD
jgi:hypothetical protein